MIPSFLEAGRGSPIVFLHGIGGAARSFQNQLEFFADQGLRAIAWDMPGYGGTSRTNPAGFDAWADALAALLGKTGAEAPVLVGHSIGGMVVQAYLARHSAGPFAARAAVLSGTSPAFGKPDGDFQKQFVAARLAPLDQGRTMAELAPELIGEIVGPDADPAGLALAESCMAAVDETSYRETVATLVTFEMRAQLGDIAVPTLCLAAENDRNAPPSVLQKMAAKIPGATYACLPKSGHLPNLEVPDAFNRAVADFLTTLSAT